MSWIKNSSLLLLSLLLSVFALEIGSRYVLPISPGVQKININSNQPLTIRFNEPGSSYRQVFAEYDAITNIDEKGNRYTANISKLSSETYIFLGDSFTFGQGVSDTDTIPSLFCKEVSAICVNLGVPGSGLVSQYKKLADYIQTTKLSKNPVLVHLILTSTSSRHAGNDIMDTIQEHLNEEKIDLKRKEDVTHPGYAVKFGRWLSRESNAFRVLRTLFGNQIRALAWKKSTNAFNEQELSLFVNYQAKIINLLRTNNIRYYPVILSTYSELALEKQAQTFSDLKKLTGLEFILGFENNPDIKSLFFPLDGHATPKGNAHVARNLLHYFKRL